jgi:hypothetical protein
MRFGRKFDVKIFKFRLVDFLCNLSHKITF